MKLITRAVHSGFVLLAMLWLKPSALCACLVKLIRIMCRVLLCCANELVIVIFRLMLLVAAVLLLGETQTQIL